MTKNLILFGAGASVGADVPVIATFLDRAYRLYADRGSAITREAFATVFDLVQNRLPLLHAKANVDLDNIEAVYGLVEMADILGKLPGTDPAALATLPETLRTVLAETVQLSCRFEFTREGGWQAHSDYAAVASALATRLQERPEPTWTILTFNYDLALDYALLRSGIEADYTFATVPPLIKHGTVELLKLHGSLNWGTLPNDSTLRHLNLRHFVDNLGPAFENGRYSWSVLQALRKVQPSNDVEVALAPPSWNKTKYYRSFGSIWKRAATALGEAENIYIIGYSAPRTDGFFQDLLALGLQGATRLERLWVVNPDEKALDRIKRMLGPQIRGRYKPFPMRFDGFLHHLVEAISQS